MAWTTARTIYAVPNQDLTVIVGAGGAPDVAIGSAVGIAYRTDGSAGSMVYETADSGTTWAAASVSASAEVTASGTGVVATSEELQVRTLLLTLTDVDVAMADEAGVVAYGSLKIADMPEGVITFLGGVCDLDLTKSSAGVNADWDGDIGVGTAAADNSATLSGTEQNIVTATATPQAVAGVTTGNAHGGTPATIDGTSTAADVYLNVLVDDADHDVTSTPCNLIANGTIKITYVVLGDY